MAGPVLNTSPVRSQRDVRTTRVFTDEFNRKWRATVNNLGVHAGYPVSPLTPLFDAPLYPPPQFLVIDDIAVGRIHTDTDAWLEDRIKRNAEYELRLQQGAVLLYGDGAEAAIKRGDRALMFRVGPPPEAVEQVEAYAQGHPWVLGYDEKKPKSLAAIFPTVVQARKPKFKTAEEEAAEEAEELPPFDPEFDPEDLPKDDDGKVVEEEDETPEVAKARARLRRRL